MKTQKNKAIILINAFEKQLKVAYNAIDEKQFITAENKVSTLIRSLKIIKKKDPLYNTSNLEKQLEDLLEKIPN